MKLKWNRVTWYSWLVAVIVFGGAIAAGFHIGRLYEGWKNDLAAVPSGAAVVQNAPDAINLSAYAGHYIGVSGDADLDISVLDGNRLGIKGLATGRGPGEMVNTGDLDGEAVLIGQTANYKKGDCELKLVFGSNSLIAEDNLKCGGLNVTFSGEYKKR
jgi:hypothetical protein